MGIYFVGAEDCDFLNFGGGVVTTDSSHFRSAYARCALQINVTTPTSYGLSSYWASPTGAFTQSSFWMTARYYDASISNAGDAGYLVRWNDSSGNARLLVGYDCQSNDTGPSTWLYQLKTVDSSGNVTILANSVAGINSGYVAKLDFYVDYASAGSFQMYVDGVPFLSYTGNLTTNGLTTLAGFNLGQSTQGNDNAGIVAWSEVIVSSSDTRSMSLETLPPNGQGATSQWTGDATGNSVNEVVLNDSSGISSDTADQIELFTQPGTSVAPFIAAVAVTARAMTASGAPQNIGLLLRSGGVTGSSPAEALANSFGFHQYIWTTDPATGNPFASLSTVQTGIESLA